jgi:hypothetical protein
MQEPPELDDDSPPVRAYRDGQLHYKLLRAADTLRAHNAFPEVAEVLDEASSRILHMFNEIHAKGPH